MLVTLSGIVIFIKPEQARNALFPMLVTLSGSVIEIKAVFPECVVSYAGDIIRDYDGGYTFATIKCVLTYTGNALRYYDTA